MDIIIKQMRGQASCHHKLTQRSALLADVWCVIAEHRANANPRSFGSICEEEREKAMSLNLFILLSTLACMQARRASSDNPAQPPLSHSEQKQQEEETVEACQVYSSSSCASCICPFALPLVLLMEASNFLWSNCYRHRG